MKAKITPIISLLFILILFSTTKAQAQTPVLAPQAQVLPQSSFTSMTERPKLKGMTPKIVSQNIDIGELDNSKSSSQGEKMKETPLTPNMNNDDNRKVLNTTKPKIITLTASQIAEVNNKVTSKVAALKAQANTSFVLDTYDNVSLHYDAGSDNIILTALDTKSLILQQVPRSSLDNVLVIQGNDKDNNLVVDNTILDLGINILYDGRGEHTATGDILTVINKGFAMERRSVYRF